MALIPTISTVPSRLLAEPAAWQRVLVIAPHPDDETLATGGLLQLARDHGADVHVVFCTDGERNAWPQRAVERRWRIDAAARTRWGTRRRAEAVGALAQLGLAEAAVTFLHAPDQGLTPIVLDGESPLLGRLTAEIATWHPTLLAAPSLRDRHPDHSATAVLVRLAVARLPPAERWFTELAYVVHGPAPAKPVLTLTLGAEAQRRKRAAILCHETQVALSRRRFLAYARSVERFVTPGSGRERHPVRRAEQRGGLLVLTLAPQLQGARLLVVGETRRCRTTLATVRIRSRQQEVRVRTSGPLARVFVKCETRRLFYDASGWREFWFAPAPGVPRRRAAGGRPASADAPAAGHAQGA